MTIVNVACVFDISLYALSGLTLLDVTPCLVSYRVIYNTLKTAAPQYPMDIFLLLSSSINSSLSSGTKSCLQHTPPTPCIFENVVVAQSSQGKFVPSISFLTHLMNKTINASRKDIERALGEGHDVGIFPGGAREMVVCKCNEDRINLVRHGGFLKIARAEGTEVVPTFIFNITDSYNGGCGGGKIERYLYDNWHILVPFWWPRER